MMRTANYALGMLTGIAVGAAVGILFDPLTDGKRRKMKKNAEKIMYTMMDMGR